MYYRLINNFILPILCIFMCMVYSSCQVYNPDEAIPSYIKVDKIILEQTPGQPSNSYNFSDVWIYIDDNSIGAFELPAKLPVLKEGYHSISIFPGIKINGISSMRGVYPFLSSFKQNINLIKDSTIEIVPSFKYTPSVNYVWTENFEDGGISFTKALISDTAIIKNTTETNSSFGGKYCGKVSLTESKSYINTYTISNLELPKTGIPIYLEMDFKSNQEFTIGVYASSLGGMSQYPVLVLNPSTEWKKVYINLTNAINSQADAKTYNVYIQALKNPDLAEGIIYIDNFKLIHYNQ